MRPRPSSEPNTKYGTIPTVNYSRHFPLRHSVIQTIRRFQPDLVLTHRTNDYHPDHRAAGQVVQDASFLVRVPLVVPDVPPLKRDPVIAFMPDPFTKPNPITADVVIDITPHLNKMIEVLACHYSQMFEWLPWIEGTADTLPKDKKQYLGWLRQWYQDQLRPMAERYRSELISVLGPDRGATVQCAEIYEISEYGTPLDAAGKQRLFGFCNDSSKTSVSCNPIDDDDSIRDSGRGC